MNTKQKMQKHLYELIILTHDIKDAQVRQNIVNQFMDLEDEVKNINNDCI